MTVNARGDAAKIITKVIAKRKPLDDVLAEHFAKYSTYDERALLQELSYGTLRWYHRLDFIATDLLAHKSKKIDPLVYSVLLVGLYQLLFLRIPVHAALFETVKAVRVVKAAWAASFINAVLREFLRRKEQVLAKAENHIVSKFSHPEWLANAIQIAWPKNWNDILQANNEYPPLHLRVNLQKITREKYLEKLNAQGIVAKLFSDLSAAITVEKPCAVSELPDFQNGFVSVQDVSAQYAANLLELKPGLRVLDACAAPGGKTTHILELEPNISELVVLDIVEERLKKVSDNLQRLQMSAKLICGDATRLETWWNGEKFDRVLLDAPCSGTGVIRRHPDIKILRKSSDIANNASLQLELLTVLWKTVADGGLLLYATCSVLPEENFFVIEKFLRRHADAKEVIITENFGVSALHGRQNFPSKNGGDGFYYAKLIKNT